MIKHQLETYLKTKRGFALWSEPGSTQIKLLFNELEGDYSFILAPFDLKTGKTFEYFSHSIQHVNTEDLENIEIPNSEVTLSNTESKSHYKTNFDHFIKELKSDSETEKLVLARTITKPITKNAFEIFADLHKAFKDNFVYLFFDGDQSFWTAATPETLIKKEDSKIETMALAGTKVRDKNGSLNWTPKEYEEHQLVVDYLANEFSEIGLKIEYPKQPIEIKAGFVWHLKTPMSLFSDQINFMDVAKHLHPTPAVCGTPKEKAKSFIINNENIDREYYCGFVGPISKTKSHLFVNLRCAKIKSNNLTVYVGGGLLKESELESEWMETINKSKTILSVL